MTSIVDKIKLKVLKNTNVDLRVQIAEIRNQTIQDVFTEIDLWYGDWKNDPLSPYLINKLKEEIKKLQSPESLISLGEGSANNLSEASKDTRINKGRFPKGEKHPDWKGGRRVTKDGYICIYSPEHPNKDKNDLVLEHRLIMEKHLGRYLTKKELVHHKDGNKKNNKIENLELMDSRGQHYIKHHMKRGANGKFM